ncbi:MAG: YedE-related selenium metabolism membrane protein [Deltaproteobacteria bacterium]|nr:YedE-related selenium metabolism membrane protein [Deltaproteobacteria bacterium]
MSLLRKNLVLLGGLLIGVMGAVLVKYGNPANMGLCFVCFYRDIAGALGLHHNALVQYLRPEILGIFLGSFISALAFKDFNPRGGSNPAIRFVLGILIMVGGLIFLGCPIRAIYRLAGGDLSAVGGILGIPFGAYLGLFFLTRGYNLGKARSLPMGVALIPVGFFVVLLALLLVKVEWQTPYPYFSLKGPGSMHAPVLLSLGLGIAAGLLFQRTRLCLAGGFRDIFLFNDHYLLKGFLGILLGAFVANMALGLFKPAVVGPVAHGNFVANFLGMGLLGFAAILLGGCPMRQMVMTWEANFDSFIAILGMLAGAGLMHSLGLAASPAGVSGGGWAALAVGYAAAFSIAYGFSLIRATAKGSA